RSVDPELDIHVILDNYATHKHPAVQRWLARHPRVTFHFVPTSASWLNLVERFFSELTTRQLKRLAVTSVDQLITTITRYIEARNQGPKPFVWAASVQHVLKKVAKAKDTSATLHYMNPSARRSREAITHHCTRITPSTRLFCTSL
ncbi:MAG: transposase, partial [Gemmatimonadota bacterium]